MKFMSSDFYTNILHLINLKGFKPPLFPWWSEWITVDYESADHFIAFVWPTAWCCFQFYGFCFQLLVENIKETLQQGVKYTCSTKDFVVERWQCAMA